jgi:hypothetical protein
MQMTTTAQEGSAQLRDNFIPFRMSEHKTGEAISWTLWHRFSEIQKLHELVSFIRLFIDPMFSLKTSTSDYPNSRLPYNQAFKVW